MFDFGGVLIDWNPRYLYRKLFDDEPAMERFLSEVAFLEWNAQMDRGREFAVTVAELAEQFPAHAPMIRAYHERWEETMGGPIQPTVEILMELKSRGVELHGLTNWSHETFVVTRTRPQYAFLGEFETIVVSGEEGVMKPDPRIFAVLLERTGRRASECLFIDDNAANVAAARQLGFQAIQFESAEQLRAELRRLRLLGPARQAR